jgi:hypothetical protein
MPVKPPVVADGDSGFIGVNMRMDPALLSPGHVAEARNKRFVNGKAATRAGVKKMPWSNKAADAWSNDIDPDTSSTKSYNAGSIVTYSGVSSEVEGTGATAAAVEDGTGTLYLKDANRLNLQSGDFTASTGWVFAGATTVADSIMLLIGSSTVFTGVTVPALSAAMPDGGTITYEGGGVFTLSAAALAGATSIDGTLTVATVSLHEEGTLSVPVWVYDAALDSAKIISGTGTFNLYQDIGTLKGCSYTVTYIVNNWTAGSIQPFISGLNSGTKRTYDAAITQPVTYTDTIVPKGINSQRLYIQATGSFRGEVTNVTVTSASLPDRVDILGAFQQWTNNWRAAGPASNVTVGPFFKAALTNSDKPPLTSYTAAAGGSEASSAVNTTYWTDMGHRTYGYGTVYGAGIFRDPDSIEYLLVATAEGVHATKESSPSTLLAGGSISSDVEFVQCFNVVVMFRGEALEPLIMERVDEGFKSITKVASDTAIDENDSDGTVTIPNGSTGLFFSNRLLIPHDKDTVAASDYLNYTRYQPVMANFKINQGSEDELVALVRINNSTIACFKTNSIYIVSNIYGNLSDITLDEVTREYGAVGRNSVVQVGSDVVFLSSKRGVTSLGIADNGKVTAIDVPLSDPIQPLVDRINWNYASGAAAAYHNNRLYMAVPLDGETYNNAILVYDFLAKAWAGYDDGNAIKVKKFIETTHQGKRRLFFLDTDGFINLYDDALTECGFVDEVPTSTDSSNADFGKLSIEQVSDEVTTRGYTGNLIQSKRWATAEVQLATSEPTLTVTAVFDGANENTKQLTPTSGLTFDRTKYDKPFHATDFNASMSADDFFTQHRQDYSVDPDTEIALPTGGSDTGFDPDLHQQSQNRFKYRGEGKYVQLKVENTNGRAELLGVVVGGSSASQSAVKQV